MTHDQEEAVLLADRVALLLDGELPQVGEPRMFYEQPASVAMRTLFSTVNFLSRGHARGRWSTLRWAASMWPPPHSPMARSR